LSVAAAERTPLRRNRDFLVLQAGQLVSSGGSAASGVALPLLTLAVTGSAFDVGLVGFVELVPRALLALPAGLLADLSDRRRLLVAADALRAAVLAGLTAAIVTGHASLGLILVAALVETLGSVVFTAAYPGALRSVVPPEQLGDALGAQEARGGVVRLGGPPLGGALFGVARSLPFLVDAVSYGASCLALLAMRTSFRQPRERDGTPLRAQLAEGFAFLWGQRFVRACAFVYVVGNATIPGVLLVLLLAGRAQGLSGAAIGGLTAAFGAATLIGAFASGLLRRRLSLRAIVLLEQWSWLWLFVFVLRPNVFVLAVSVLPLAACLPVTDSAVNSHRLRVTPDHLVGRVESARRAIALTAAPFGPLLAGALVGATSARIAVAIFAGAGALLAVWATASPALRAA
jgi:MFS family permease